MADLNENTLIVPQHSISASNSQVSLAPSYTEMEKQSTQNDDEPRSPLEFNPSSNAHPYSPFYDHDTPRPSTEQFKFKQDPIHISIVDLEAASAKLTPCASTNEKQDKGNLGLWNKRKQCMTKPRRRRLDWFRALPKKQQIAIELLLALLIIGAMVGVGFGISAGVHGGVYKNDNQQPTINT